MQSFANWLTRLFVLVCAILATSQTSWGLPSEVSYQGQLKSDGALYNGTANMKFVILDGSTSLWSNDGSSVDGSQPTNAVAVPVDAGVFTVRLGVPPMIPLTPAVFEGSSNPVLRVWASDGGVFEQLSPDQPLSSVPFAFQSTSGAGIPPGSVMPYMGTAAPEGWLLCDGSEVSRTMYPQLYAVIGTASGSGNGSSTFNLPDLRGRFLRGWDHGAGVDPDAGARTAAKPGGNVGDNIGSLQVDEFKQHDHSNGNFNRILQYTGNNTAVGHDEGYQEPDIINAAPMTRPGGAETRPKNLYVNYIIKY